MKKVIFFLCFTISLPEGKAQTWNTGLNEGSGLKLGTSTNDALNFYTHGNQAVSISPQGELRVNSLSGSGAGILYADENGILGRQIGASPGGPCMSPGLPWSQGGNSYALDITAGTCDYNDFILKANNIQSVFLKTSGYVGIGVNNNNPQAMLDISDNTYTNTNSEHLKIYGDLNGTIESTNQMNLYYKANTQFCIRERPATGAALTRLAIANGVANVTADMKISGKTVIGLQSGAANGAKLNINLNSTGTGANADNAIDVFDQASNKINFRLKASGYVYAREINVMPTNINFPDYVFENNYHMLSIQETEKFIHQYKHLPNIPTASEINQSGINLGELQVKQMEKIEEAYLYIIQLKKENEALKERLERLEKKMN